MALCTYSKWNGLFGEWETEHVWLITTCTFFSRFDSSEINIPIHTHYIRHITISKIHHTQSMISGYQRNLQRNIFTQHRRHYLKSLEFSRNSSDETFSWTRFLNEIYGIDWNTLNENKIIVFVIWHLYLVWPQLWSWS